MTKNTGRQKKMAQSPSDALSLLRSQSLATVVQQEIERLILSGEFAPNEKLSEERMAEHLSVSRGPVREAFRALSQAGLVRIEKNRGVSVRQISVQEADEIYEVRAGLDAMIGRLAAKRITEEQLEQLAGLIETMEESASVRNVEAYYPLNVEFHDLLATFTNNRTLLETYRRIVKELHLFRRATLARAADSFPISIREHSEIVEALRKRDGRKASRLLYEHAIESQERLHHLDETHDPLSKGKTIKEDV
jgi:phosphonate utilization transcriptional regulator